MTLTEGRERALRKAKRHGFVLRPGDFCPENQMPVCVAIEDDRFDTRQIIEHLLSDGLLIHGEGTGQYVMTQAAMALLERLDRLRKRREQRVAA